MSPEMEKKIEVYMRIRTVDFYTHGYCCQNTGAGGFGYVIRYWSLDNGVPVPDTVEYSEGFRLTTRNRMELMAAIHGIRSILNTLYEGRFHRILNTCLKTDYDYIFNTTIHDWLKKWQKNNWYTSEYKGSKPHPVKNRDLWEQLLEFKNEYKSMSVNWKIICSTGCADDESHKRARKLAMDAAADIRNYSIDEMYEKTVQNNKQANAFF